MEGPDKCTAYAYEDASELMKSIDLKISSRSGSEAYVTCLASILKRKLDSLLKGSSKRKPVHELNSERRLKGNLAPTRSSSSQLSDNERIDLPPPRHVVSSEPPSSVEPVLTGNAPAELVLTGQATQTCQAQDRGEGRTLASNEVAEDTERAGSSPEQSQSQSENSGEEAGEPSGQNAQDLFDQGMSLIYSKGNTKEGPRDFSSAAKLFHQAALKHHAGAQCELADMYEEGLGVAKDFEMCEKWHERAAEQGFGPSLAKCYLWADGSGCTDAEAADLNKMAAAGGHPGAQCALGYLYEEDIGVAEDPEASARWYLRAAEQDHAMGQFHVGLCYYAGRGVPQNQATADYWLQRAARDNCSLSSRVGTFYYYSQEYQKAVLHLERAITLGSSGATPLTSQRECVAKAHTALGKCCQEGKGTPKDIGRAMKHFGQGMELGDSDAKRQLEILQGKAAG